MKCEYRFTFSPQEIFTSYHLNFWQSKMYYLHMFIDLNQMLHFFLIQYKQTVFSD